MEPRVYFRTYKNNYIGSVKKEKDREVIEIDDEYDVEEQSEQSSKFEQIL